MNDSRARERILASPLSTQPSPQGFALQLELRPSPPAGARDQNESLSLGEGEGWVMVALSRE